MDIKDFKICLYECKNKHNIKNILLNSFEETQKIDRLKIICDICKTNNKSTSDNNVFYICNICNKNICPSCKKNHDEKHKIINYDYKYYICDKHNEKFISYCEDCKLNLCNLCVDHNEHKRTMFLNILPKKDDLKKKMEELKDRICLIDQNIKLLMQILKEVMDKLNIYYKINEDIINIFDDNNTNFEVINYLNKFQNNNIIEDLTKVIDSYAITDKFNNLFNIYSKMNFDEITLVYNVKNKKEIQLFGDTFVERYKGKCKIIINGVEQELKNIHYFGMFFGTNQEILEIKLKGIKNITNMSCMFNLCSSLILLPNIDKWDTSYVKDMSGMFYLCSSLTCLPDISKWNTSNVKNMTSMFSKCKSLVYLPDISKWDISNVKYMGWMFNECSSLKSLPDISKWDISNVKDMNNMFSQCSKDLNIPAKFDKIK